MQQLIVAGIRSQLYVTFVPYSCRIFDFLPQLNLYIVCIWRMYSIFFSALPGKVGLTLTEFCIFLVPHQYHVQCYLPLAYHHTGFTFQTEVSPHLEFLPFLEFPSFSSSVKPALAAFLPFIWLSDSDLLLTSQDNLSNTQHSTCE